MKEHNCELETLIENSKKLTVLDATLTIQNEHVPEIMGHWEECKRNLDFMSSKLEHCLNSLPLSANVIIEDPSLLEK